MSHRYRGVPDTGLTRASQRIRTRTPDRQTQPTTNATNNRATTTIVATLLFTLNSKHVLSSIAIYYRVGRHPINERITSR